MFRYSLTSKEVDQAIKEYADNRIPDGDTAAACIPDFASVKLEADGGAVIEAEYMDD